MELKNLNGIGAKTLLLLNENNINNVNDLLYYFPISYDIYEENYDNYLNHTKTLITGTILSKPAFKKIHTRTFIVIFYIEYKCEKIKCITFSSDYLKYQIKIGAKISLYGMLNDNNEFIVNKVFIGNIETKIENNYKNKDIKSSYIKKAIKDLFNSNITVEETLPEELINKYKLLDIKNYLYLSHLARNKNDVKEVLRRRKYEELFWYQIRLNLLSYKRKNQNKNIRNLDFDDQEFFNLIDFKLTIDQLNIMNDIKNDIKSNLLMNRIIEGDVGSGKSIIAYYSSYLEIKAKYQACIMLPTEILAKQQYENIKQMMSKLGIITELLTSSTPKKVRSDILYRLEAGRIDIIVGTHSLLNSSVRFKNLGIVIIDEQHKFGVMQRESLVNKYKNVDVLYMSATPIPRTLGMTLYGNLDISTIHTMPQNRKKTKTILLPYSKIKGLMTSIRNEIDKNHQIYIVVPRVSDLKMGAISVIEAHDIVKKYLPDKKILCLHSKMDSTLKNEIMNDFLERKIDILISTTVIEVGVNNPNATVMVIMDAERFGLAQIHQLRGRVGRSMLQSYCVLLSNEIDNKRLNIILNNNDGFLIAEEDFKLRGPGDYLGNNQSGDVNLEYSSFDLDLKILECTSKDAKDLMPKFIKKEIESKVFNDIIIIDENKISS